MNPKEDLELAENISKLAAQVQYFKQYASQCQNKAISLNKELGELRFLIIALMVKNDISGFTIPNDFLPKLERFIGSGMDLMRRKTKDGWVVEFKNHSEDENDTN